MFEFLILPIGGYQFSLPRERWAMVLHPSTLPYDSVGDGGDEILVNGQPVDFVEHPGITVCFDGDTAEDEAGQIVREVSENLTAATGQKAEHFEVRVHPTHHRPFIIALAAVAWPLTAYMLLSGFFGLPMGAWFAGVFFGCIVVVLIGVSIYCRHCSCPNCSKRLDLDRKLGRSRSNTYLCPGCRIVWESRIAG
jgi:predicted RNA-binding Zn-ribbon protein involved in translation (DUF1610 family)